MYQHLGGAYHIQSISKRTIQDGYHDASVFAELCLTAWKEFHHDNVMAGWGDCLMEAQAFGVKLSFPVPTEYPRGVEVPFERLDDLQPVDPLTNKIWSIPLKAAMEMRERVQDNALVLGTMNDPFVVSGGIRGYENLLLDQIVQPDVARRLSRTVTESLNEYGRHLKEYSGLEAVFVEDGLSDAQQNDLTNTTNFDIAYCKELIDGLRTVGLRVILSNCSMEPYIKEQFSACSPTAMHFPVEWKGYGETVENLNDLGCVVAGLHQRRTIYEGTPATIRKKVREVIDSFGARGGLIISSAGEMAFDMPPENIIALVNATENYDCH